MSIHVALHHKTSYRYDRAVNLGPQIVRLRPAPHSRTRILSYSLRVTPAKHFINWQQDPQSNYLARLVFPQPTREFQVEVDLVAEMAVHNPFDFFLEASAEKFPFKYDPALDHELEPFRLKKSLSPQFEAYVGKVEREIIAPTNKERNLRTIDFLVGANRRVYDDIRYLIRLEPGVQTPEETLTKGSGSCRDSAWLLCQVLRHYGLATRFVSGYLIQLTADVKSLDGPSGTEKDFTDLHAWTEVYLPGAGWIGVDPTSGLLAGEGHIPLAATPDPTSAAPINGVVDDCKCDFQVEMKVTRIIESPRVTKPYTEEQWAKIESLGELVEADLAKNDVRLTMGGEPTFVSIDDMDGPEWNLTALGPRKRFLAGELMKRLKRIYAPNGFIHYGQGKWYPGESLPRWAFGCYWRKDDKPIWLNPKLLADHNADYRVNGEQACQFSQALARRLNLDVKCITPAYEDTWYYLWRERRLPVNVDPLASKLEDEEERKRLAKVFEQKLSKIVGYAIPVRRESDDSGAPWISGPWFLRTDRMYLLPGDSPMGLRLPVDSLPWVKPSDYPFVNEQDPTERRAPLPERPIVDRQRLLRAWQAGATPAYEFGRPTSAGQRLAETKEPGERKPDSIRAPARGESADSVVRTALCVEPRDGKLHIFMPPVRTLEDYLDLLAAIEDTADYLEHPVIIEGYTPPADPRLSLIKVTPDPGVIEVNIHPAGNWSELVRNTTTLYEEARQSRLGTEKFMLDGRHTGTGGGNHIVIGGATPADSPFLRRPDLLRSLVGYWQNHPSLSYLFSGLFIGPTSQAPRVDEARNDSLYELEIAFKQIKKTESVPPWMSDRLFRNLLIDATGNTHRAEFCIDKLYSPDSASGRLGLLEMRAFEMPPHTRMSLTQQLLLRSLISKFWRKPYEEPLVRWRTELHDRFMLPHFVWDDFRDVIADLESAGYLLSSEWFTPHLEFRFPQHGEMQLRNIVLELRQALEPWHVLGEEGAPGGAVRYVDSSVERIQVKAQGLIDSRHVITCNGQPVPLHTTGTNGEYVAGVRYRAWQPESCLHPTIPVQSPLTFDVVDRWNGRSVCGCTYHVMHPGGLSHTTFPVNAYEAESRRLARFFRHGHTPGPMKVGKAGIDPEFPLTLDLRNV